MKRAVVIAASAAGMLAGCSRASGPTGEPIDRMFDARYEKFISSAKAHTGKCTTSVSAKGDAGTKRDAVESSVDVDADGNFRVHVDGGLEVVRVGSIAWQREKDAKFERIESGARTDILRDDAIAGWRDVLAPMRDRMTLTRAETTELGDRTIEVYRIAIETGGGNDGGAQVIEADGGVGLDAQTGFPVKITFKGSWEGPATPPAEGRVTWTIESLECAITIPDAVEAITPAIPIATTAPAVSATPASTAAPAKTPTPVPTAARGTKTKPKTK